MEKFEILGKDLAYHGTIIDFYKLKLRTPAGHEVSWDHATKKSVMEAKNSARETALSCFWQRTRLKNSVEIQMKKKLPVFRHRLKTYRSHQRALYMRMMIYC